MDSQESDTALVERVQKGDKQAFNLLVQKYQFRIRHLVARFISDTVEQEDIVQEALIKAYRAIARFRGESAFYTWLYRITVNTVKNHIVASGRRPLNQNLDIDEVMQSNASSRLIENNSPERVLQNDEIVIAVRRAIDELPAELKEAIQLRELDGLSYEEIAGVMSCPIGTVRSRIFRARESIESVLVDYVDG